MGVTQGGVRCSYTYLFVVFGGLVSRMCMKAYFRNIVY